MTLLQPTFFDAPEPQASDVTVSPSGTVSRPPGPKPWLAAYCNHKWREEGGTLRCEGLCECSFPDWRKK